MTEAPENSESFNEIKPEFLSVCGLNSFHQHTSSSRAYMFANHLGQMLVLNGSTVRTIQSGVEREYGKYTFKVEMPCDGLIIEVIDYYKQGMGMDSINENPETIVIYEDDGTKEIGMLRLPRFCSNHQYFGFKYSVKDTVNMLVPGARIPKGTVFLDSPSITDEGDYKYGVQANVAYMTIPSTSEDGIAIRKGYLKQLGFKTFETRSIEWGFNKYALNLYGDLKNYKPFPDIGEEVRKDGLLMALRTNLPEGLAVVERSVSSTMEVDYTFDNTIYANGPGGRVVDIRIHHNLADNNYADVHMDKQPQKYDNAKREFCATIVNLWKRLERQRGEALVLSQEFHRLVVECYSVEFEAEVQRKRSDPKTAEAAKKIPKLQKTYRKTPIDNFRAEFVIEYDIEVGVGFKLTDCHGGKGVICQVIDDDDMPVDEDGNRADIVMDPNSTISRMNEGRLFEQYFNAASRDVHKRICKAFGLDPFATERSARDVIGNAHVDSVDKMFDYLLGYYKIMSPRMYDWFADGKIPTTKVNFLAEIVNRGVSLFIPTDNQPMSEDMILRLQEETALVENYYKPIYGPVSYVGNSGKRVTTKRNVRIGSVYMILLEKTGDDWAAVSSGKRQCFGILSQITKQDKHSKPARNQAVRGSGEAEVRIMAAYIGPNNVAELMDRNNNPNTHKLIINKILESDTPTNIENLVDRKVYPFGGSKPLQLVKHILEASGIEFIFSPHNSNLYY